jgi:hypothetical protein
MKWRKMPYNEKANTHRAGWKFWDLLDSNDQPLCTVRFIPDTPLGFGYDILNSYNEDFHAFAHHKFATLKEAQDYAVAYFINKRLEEA